MNAPKPKPPAKPFVPMSRPEIAAVRTKEAFDAMGPITEEAGKKIKALGDAIKLNKVQGPRKPHLTHRPFVNPAIVTLRKGLQDSTRIKKK